MPSLDDLLFAFSQWLKTTPLVEVSQWIGNTRLSTIIQENFWTIPIAQTIHILSIAALFGSAVMINLRILDLAGRSRTMEQTAHRFLPWIWWSLATLLATGFVMIIGEPIRELLNPAFWTKMGLILVAIGITLWFQNSVARDGASWQSSPERRIIVRTGAVAVLLLWCAIMAFGRWIAYAPI